MAESQMGQKLQRLEESLEALKALYDQYFTGLIRVEPSDEQNDWLRQLQSIPYTELSTAPYRFRYKNIKAKHQSLARLWTRTVKQIEEGTYRRDHLRRQAKALPLSNEVAESRAIEKLYETLQSKVGPNKPALNRDKFFSQMKSQIQAFKKRNPEKNFQFRVSKGSKGELQIKIQKKA